MFHSPAIGSGRRRLGLSLAAASLALVLAMPAAAMVGGHSDGNDHPYVAAIGQPDGQGIVFTGVAISPTVVLTVAHGAARLEQATGSDQARVTFDPIANASSTWYTGTIHIDPSWNPWIGIGDLAVITFAQSLPVSPASLPSAGLLDQLGQPVLLRSSFDVVGYGLTGYTGGSDGSGRPQANFDSGGNRKVDRALFLAFNPKWVWLQMPGADQLCIGDSGAPTILGDSDVLVGLLSAVSGLQAGCSSSGSVADTRLDTPSARAFIGQYVALP